MTDTTTNKLLRVSTDGTVRPHIEVPVSQLGEVRRLLDSRHIEYCVEEDVISFNGAPEVAVIDLRRGADVAVIQALLDSVP